MFNFYFLALRFKNLIKMDEKEKKPSSMMWIHYALIATAAFTLTNITMSKLS